LLERRGGARETTGVLPPGADVLKRTAVDNRRKKTINKVGCL
jgi:hypothetical protein